MASLVDDAAQVIEGLFEDGDSRSRDPVGTAPSFGIESLDEPRLLEPSHRLVQGARTETNARKAFDVLHQAVAMSLTGDETRQDEEGHAADSVVPSLETVPRRNHVLTILRSAELR